MKRLSGYGGSQAHETGRRALAQHGHAGEAHLNDPLQDPSAPAGGRRPLPGAPEDQAGQDGEAAVDGTSREALIVHFAGLMATAFGPRALTVATALRNDAHEADRACLESWHAIVRELGTMGSPFGRPDCA